MLLASISTNADATNGFFPVSTDTASSVSGGGTSVVDRISSSSSSLVNLVGLPDGSDVTEVIVSMSITITPVVSFDVGDGVGAAVVGAAVVGAAVVGAAVVGETLLELIVSMSTIMTPAAAVVVSSCGEELGSELGEEEELGRELGEEEVGAGVGGHSSPKL